MTEEERDDIHGLIESALRKFGYRQIDFVLGYDGGYEATWRTWEGYAALRNGTSASGRDPQGHEAKPAGPVSCPMKADD